LSSYGGSTPTPVLKNDIIIKIIIKILVGSSRNSPGAVCVMDTFGDIGAGDVE
jgi:hypothetical protein